MTCPFCELDPSRVCWEGDHVFAIRDGYPVSPGHTLVIPRRHVAGWFEVTDEEQVEIWQAVGEIKVELDREHAPEGYNVGINVGEAAGQTVMHVHVHLIPRFEGDAPNPRGGVRNSIPGKGDYTAEDWDG